MEFSDLESFVPRLLWLLTALGCLLAAFIKVLKRCRSIVAELLKLVAELPFKKAICGIS